MFILLANMQAGLAFHQAGNFFLVAHASFLHQFPRRIKAPAGAGFKPMIHFPGIIPQAILQVDGCFADHPGFKQYFNYRFITSMNHRNPISI